MSEIKIKPLVWEEYWCGCSARTPFHMYQICINNPQGDYLIYEDSINIKRNISTLEEGKTIVQKRYNAKITEALELL